MKARIELLKIGEDSTAARDLLNKVCWPPNPPTLQIVPSVFSYYSSQFDWISWMFSYRWRSGTAHSWNYLPESVSWWFTAALCSWTTI